MSVMLKAIKIVFQSLGLNKKLKHPNIHNRFVPGLYILSCINPYFFSLNLFCDIVKELRKQSECMSKRQRNPLLRNYVNRVSA